MNKRKPARKSLDNALTGDSADNTLELAPFLTKEEKEFVKGTSKEKETRPKYKNDYTSAFVKELKQEGKPRKKRLTIEIDEDLYEAICKLAVETRHSKKDVIEKALKRVILKG